MSALCLKRLRRELAQYASERDEYMIDYDDADMLTVHAVIKAPPDSLYAHKFARVTLKFADDYPFKPPHGKFHNFRGTRIHPNLYAQGKICLSILGTWEGPGWVSTMNVNVVLRTIQSLLDNQPYLHEPHQRDNPRYNWFVQHETWNSCLLSYLENERRPRLRDFMFAETARALPEIERAVREQASQREPGGSIRAYGGETPTPQPLPAVLEKIKQRVRAWEATGGKGPSAVAGDAAGAAEAPVKSSAAKLSTAAASSEPKAKAENVSGAQKDLKGGPVVSTVEENDVAKTAEVHVKGARNKTAAAQKSRAEVICISDEETGDTARGRAQRPKRKAAAPATAHAKKMGRPEV